MDRRDYFAGQALAGLLAYPDYENTSILEFEPAVIAERAFVFAEEMIKQSDRWGK